MPRKRPDSADLIDRHITRRIIGAFFECYNHLGYGQFESVYRKALMHELHLRELTASEEALFQVRYKEVLVGLLLHFGPEPHFERRINAELFHSRKRQPCDAHTAEDHPASSGESG
jgi:hypothetical protein